MGLQLFKQSKDHLTPPLLMEWNKVHNFAVPHFHIFQNICTGLFH